MRLIINVLEILLIFGLIAASGPEKAGGAASGGSKEAGDMKMKGEVKTERATFAAGCFWGVESTFRSIEGVLSTQVGYTGGSTDDPDYHDVCSGKTGHAEAVEVTYDPSVVSYDELLKVFYALHDPTQLDRQGPDLGNQYRSAVFFHSPEQETKARAYKQKLEESGRYKRPVVTQIVPATAFYRAEEYHQQYLEKLGRKSCGSY